MVGLKKLNGADEDEEVHSDNNIGCGKTEEVIKIPILLRSGTFGEDGENQENAFTTPKFSKRTPLMNGAEARERSQRKKTTLLQFPKKKTFILTKKEDEYFSGSVFNPKRLFENFCVVSVKKDFVTDSIQGAHNVTNKPLKYQGELIYDFADDIKLQNGVQNEFLPAFLSPNGIPIQKIEGASAIQNLICKLLTKTKRKHNKKFILPLRPHTDEIQLAPWQDYVEAMNIHDKLFAICVLKKDYYCVDDKKKNKEYFVAVNTVYCFLTYYPYPKLFYDFFGTIFNLIRKGRKLLYYRTNGKVDTKKADFSNVIDILKYDVKNYLDRLIKSETPSPSTTLSYDYFNDIAAQPIKVDYNYPDIKKAWLELGGFGFQKLMPIFGHIDIVWLLSAIILEKSIVFMSENVKILTYTINFLLALICPLKYMCTIVSLLPNDSISLVDSPVPIIIGINKGESYFIDNELYNSDSVIFVFLDQGIILAQKNSGEFPVFSALNEKAGTFYTNLGGTYEGKFEVVTSLEKFKSIKKKEKQTTQRRKSSFLGIETSPSQSIIVRENFVDAEKLEKYFCKFRFLISQELVGCMRLFENKNPNMMPPEEVVESIESFTFESKTREFLLEFKNTLTFNNYPDTVNKTYSMDIDDDDSKKTKSDIIN